VLVTRHEALRTTFALFEGSPAQRIAARGMAFWRRVELAALPPEDRDAAVFRLLRRENRRPFDLARGPVLRAILFRLADDDHVLSIAAPAIALDRWSLGLVARDLGRLYEAEVAGVPAGAPAVPAGGWPFEPSDSGGGAGSHEPRRLELPYDRAGDDAPRRAGARISFAVDETLTEALRELARAERATLFMVLLAAFAALVKRYTDQDALLIGTAVAHRLSADFDDFVGCLGDDVAFEIDAGGGPTFRELVGRARAAVLRVNDLRPSRASLAAARAPVQVGISLERADDPPRFADLRVETLDVDDLSSTCEIGLSLRARGLGLSGVATYRGDLFTRSTIQRLLDHFGSLVASAAADPDRPIGSLSILSPAERRRVVSLGRAPSVHVDPDETIWSHIDGRAAAAPSAVALEAGDDIHTFCELRTEALTVAAALGAEGVGPARRVGVLIDDPVKRVAACLGVLASGAAFVPLQNDPGQVAYVTDDAGLAAILTDDPAGNWSSPARRAGAIVMAVADVSGSHDRKAGRPPSPSALEPAYVIYGGGPEGDARGIVVEHRAVLARLAWYRRQFPLHPGETVLVRREANRSSSWGVLHALAAGGRCVFEPRDSDDGLASHVAASQAAYVRVTAAGLEHLIADASVRDLGTCRSLRAVVCESEGLEPALVESFYECVRGVGLRDVRLHAVYGWPETAGDVLHWACPPAGAAPRLVVLGRPIAGARVYVVDAWGRLCPVGVPGEVWIGGTPIARGFLGRSDLTSERFLPDPFASAGRVFRTGERARWRSDGQLESVGGG
jgi:non-ribosomal peptide synthetase component F